MLRTLPSWCLGMLVGAWAGVAGAAAEKAAEERFDDFIKSPLLLSSDAESAADQFQFEVRVRLISDDGSTVEQRSVAERSGDKAAVLLLSPGGFPAALLIEKTCLTIGAEEIKGFHGGQFRFQAGIVAQGGLGITMPYSSNPSRDSQITLDLNALARQFLEQGGQVTWDEHAARYSVATPGGARLSLYVERDAEAGRFPIRAVAATALGRTSTARIELTVSNIYVGTTPPRTLFRTADWENLPLVPAPFAEIKASHLKSLGAAFDESDQAACAIAAKLLRKFLTQESLVVPNAELNRIRALVEALDGAEEPGVWDALAELHSLGARFVWGSLQSPPLPGGRRSQLDYDRFKAAGHTEIAFGPRITRRLRERLVGIATGARFTVAARCEAIDLLGQFGLPLLAPLMAELETSLAGAPEEELQVVLASVRVRHGLARGEDLSRLHRAVADDRFAPAGVTQAIEALAIVGELGSHHQRLETLIVGDQGEYGEQPGAAGEEPAKRLPVPRRVRAAAADPAGRAILLELLERGGEALPAAVGMLALLEALTSDDEGWPRLLNFARDAALDMRRSVAERVAANQVVHRDHLSRGPASPRPGDGAAAGYAEAFLQSALDSKEVELIAAAMANMILLGQDSRCYEIIHSLFKESNPAKRNQYATLLGLVGSFQRAHGQRLPDSFWTALDRVFADPDLQVRVAGLSTIALLLGADTWIPSSYVKPLVCTALESEDSAHLATVCIALHSVTRGDYRPPAAATTGPEFLDRVRQHAPTVREHLRKWHADYQDRQWQPPLPTGEPRR